jgi:hypothetical protein
MTISLGTIDFTIKSGAVIPLLVMLPNILWMILPKEGAAQGKPVPTWLNILENIGRIGILVVPFFYALDFHQPYLIPVLVGMGLALGIYYACWLNYFTHGRKAELLRAPFMGIPLPLAVAPVVFLLLSSYLMGSWLMLAVSAVFGVAHIWVSKISL